MSRFAGGKACFEHSRDAFRFFALAAVAATAISASIGVLSLTLGGLAKWDDVGPIWLTWWLGDAAGALLVTPLVLLWHATPRPVLVPEQKVEAVVLIGVAMAVAAACFAGPVLRDYPLAFLCVPPLAWIAFRLGPREVATANVLVATIAVVATETGLGSFVMATRNESLLVLQAFMAMVAVTLLTMAALVREHRIAVAEAQAATRARDVFLAMLSHDGYEVARRLREAEARLGSRSTLIALTGYGQPEDVRRAMAAGFDRHLVKPVFPEALKAVL